MKNRRNYYRILQVQEDAPLEIIRASFRTLMRELKQHPDLGGSTSAAALLNEAYETLSDPERRVAYDRSLPPPRVKRSDRVSPTAGKSQSSEPACPLCKRPLERQARPGDRCPTCQVPLQSKRRSGSGHLSRRSVTRLKKGGKVLYCSAWPQREREAEMIDLSPLGMRFRGPENLRPGTVLKLRAPLLDASAVVTNIREEGSPGHYTVGVSFLAVDFGNQKGSFISVSA